MAESEFKSFLFDTKASALLIKSNSWVIKSVKSPSKDLPTSPAHTNFTPFSKSELFPCISCLIIYCFILSSTCLKCVKLVLQLDCKLHEGKLMTSISHIRIKKQKITSYQWGYRENSCTVLVGIKMGKAFKEKVLKFSKKLNIDMSKDSAILSLGIHEMKSKKGNEINASKRYLYSHVHCSISHIGKIWKTTQLSSSEWMDKKFEIICVYTYLPTEYYSA